MCSAATNRLPVHGHCTRKYICTKQSDACDLLCAQYKLFLCAQICVLIYFLYSLVNITLQNKIG